MFDSRKIVSRTAVKAVKRIKTGRIMAQAARSEEGDQGIAVMVQTISPIRKTAAKKATPQRPTQTAPLTPIPEL